MADMSLSMRIGAVVDGSLNRVLGGVNRDLDRLGSTTSQLTARQERLNRIIERGAQNGHRDLTRYRREQERVTRAIEETRQAQERLNRSVERGRRIGDAQSQAGSNLTSSTAQLTAFALPVGAAVKQAAVFQDQLTDLAITGGWSASEQVRIGQTVRATALSYNQTLTDINAGLGVLVAGGIGSAKELEVFAPKMTRIATAWRTSFEDVGNTALALQTNLSIGADGFDRAMNMLGYAGKAGQFEARDMAKWLPSLTPFYKTLGVQGEKAVSEIGAALQVARMGAGTSDEAANNMRNFMAKLTAPDTIKDFDHAGIDLKASMKSLVNEGLTPMGAMMRLIEQYIGSKSPKATNEFVKAMAIKDDKERQMAVDRLAETYKLGELFQDQQALSFIRPMLNNKDEFERIKIGSEQAANNDGIGKDFTQRMQSPVEQFKQFKINITELVVTIGDALLPALNSSIIAITPVVQSFATWAKANPDLVASIVKIVGGLLLAKVAFWGVSFAVLSVIRPIASLVTTFNRLRADIALLRGMSALGRFAPIFSKIRGAATLASRGILFFGKTVLRLAAWVGSVAVRSLLVLGRTLFFIAKIGLRGLMLLGRGLFMFAGIIRTVGIALLTNPLFIAIGLLAVAAYLIYRNWTPIKAFFIGLWNGLKSAVMRGVNSIKGTLARFNPLPIFSRAWASVTTYFSGLPARFRQYGINIIQGLIGGVTAKFGELKAKMSEMASSVSGWFKSKLGINSPSRVFMSFGENIAEGVAIGITQKTPTAITASDAMAKRLAQTQYSNSVLGSQSLSGGMSAGSISFSPTINVQVAAGATDVAGQVQQGLNASYAEFERMLEQVEGNRRRRAFA